MKWPLSLILSKKVIFSIVSIVFPIFKWFLHYFLTFYVLWWPGSLLVFPQIFIEMIHRQLVPFAFKFPEYIWLKYSLMFRHLQNIRCCSGTCFIQNMLKGSFAGMLYSMLKWFANSKLSNNVLFNVSMNLSRIFPAHTLIDVLHVDLMRLYCLVFRSLWTISKSARQRANQPLSW